MYIDRKSCGNACMAENFSERFRVETALNTAGGKAVPERVEGTVVELVTFQKFPVANVVLMGFRISFSSCQ